MDYDEHEQSERVRSWLSQNGTSLLTGILMGLALVFGWQWWQNRGGQHREEASGQYASLDTALEAKDAAKAKVLAGQLGEKFGDTGYATLASLRQAAFLHEAGKGAEALAVLRSARAKEKDASIVEIIDIRIARLLLIDGKADEAARELAKLNNPHFVQVVDELRGDVAIARGQRDEARKDYERALGRLDQAAPTRPLLELKLIDAGGQPPTAKPET
jgi:predicted negative regulator of RcsB-dependent stress response